MLSLINVQVHASVDKFENTMWRAADVADQSMSAAAANADKFQTAFESASDQAASAADRMAGRFQAANDSVMSSAGKTVESINTITDSANKVDLRTWQEKVAEAFGAGVGGGVVAAQTWFDKVEEFASAKLKAIGIGLAIGLVSATAAAAYGAYKIVSASVGFLEGLITGDSYKSANIDALIAMNQEIKTLQERLHLTAVEASALNEALKGLGVDRGAYVSTLEAAEKAARGNTEELERLGVKYKDANGNLLPFQETLANAKTVLDGYTEGWDRNQAAAALGMGSYKDIGDALLVTSEKVETAKQRLIDYNLIIGPGTQAAVSAYEASMRAFQRESDLTGQGFKRAIADQIMPILTDLADFFRDGFPFVVNSFRYSMATLTSLFYGLKEVVYITAEVILESFGAIGDVVLRVGDAMSKALSGDFKGAVNELMSVPDDFSKRWDMAGKNIVAQSRHNVEAMKLNWGADSLTANEAAANQIKKGKTFIPKSDKKDSSNQAVFDPRKLILEGQLKDLDRSIAGEADLMKSRDDMLKSFYDRGDITREDYYQRRNQVDGDALASTRGYYAKEIAAIDEYQGHYVAGTKEWLEAANKMAEVQDKLAKADQAAAAAATKTWLEESANQAEVGINKAFSTYEQTAGATADNMSGMFTRGFKNMDDALTNFVTKGKLNFSSLTSSIINDLVRMQVQESVTKPLFSMMQGSGVGSFITNLFGGGRAAGGPTSAGSFYEVNETGPELLQSGGKTFLMMGSQDGNVIPMAGATSGVGSAGAQINYNPTIQIDARNADSSVLPNLDRLVRGALAQNADMVVQIVNRTMNARGRAGITA
ncbi:MAG TPA: phage tail tape measure C-terminal domain-containing protein [Rhodocyclaceae bacterium]|jgi:hypothetical protein